jgi:hypothetical protein
MLLSACFYQLFVIVFILDRSDSVIVNVPVWNDRRCSVCAEFDTTSQCTVNRRTFILLLGTASLAGSGSGEASAPELNAAQREDALDRLVCRRCQDHEQSGVFVGLPSTPCSMCQCLQD